MRHLKPLTLEFRAPGGRRSLTLGRPWNELLADCALFLCILASFSRKLVEKPVPITFHPRVGQVLLCDFSAGFKEPEMVKSGRPVIVLSPPISGRSDLVTVVALSTKEPDNAMPYHYRLPKAALPQLGRFQEDDTWVKGDMIYTVGFHRLDLIMLNKRHPTTGKRIYFTQRLGREQMAEVYKCVLQGLNLAALAVHL